MSLSTVERAISDARVRERTGHGWDHWFAVLDGQRGGHWDHTAVARHLEREHGLSAWWSQTLVVQYEQERGLRLPGQRGRHFVVEVRRTIRPGAEHAFAALVEPAHLSRWFTSGAVADVRVGGSYSNDDGDKGRFLVLDRPRRAKMTWENENHCPGTEIEFVVAERPPGRVLVTATHSRLRDQTEYTDMKEGWQWAMDSLRSYLETGKGIRMADWTRHRA